MNIYEVFFQENLFTLLSLFKHQELDIIEQTNLNCLKNID